VRLGRPEAGREGFHEATFAEFVPVGEQGVKYLAFAAVAICLALYAWTVLYDRSLREADPFGYRNQKACTKIAPGVSEADLVRVLGSPEKIEEAGGVRRLQFHTLRVASAPINAAVDPTTGKVLELRCLDDGKPTWTLQR
jgi:hypothetical protein